ncbi:hypothetical protein [Psychroserpens damuponensis]|uniref:hypothetical protein n=1 Tax=Psychroserpens damuponensis TaxID=943936 RepID=UPI00058D140D|nr:hypothetical protein [Psychroserpens damuponensis]
MTQLTSILALLFSALVFAQHTENFNTIASQIKPYTTELVDLKFKNGNQKEKGILNVFQIDNYQYTFPTGVFKEYYKSGELFTEANFDAFGNALYWKCYDKDGTLVIDSKTIKIDTNAQNLKQLLDLGKFIEVVTYEKEFRYSYKLCKWYLFSEGQRLNNKKTGNWKKYHDNGALKKETDF